MSQYVALKTFKGEYGPMNRGMTYTLPERYARDLQRLGLVRPMAVQRAPQNIAHEEAPRTSGEDMAGRQDAGQDKQSSALPPARRSRRKTVATLNRGPR